MKPVETFDCEVCGEPTKHHLLSGYHYGRRTTYLYRCSKCGNFRRVKKSK